MSCKLSNPKLTRDELNEIYQALGANDADQSLLDKIFNAIETAESVARFSGDSEAVISFLAKGAE